MDNRNKIAPRNYQNQIALRNNALTPQQVMEAIQEEARKSAEKNSQQQAIAAQSANARSLATVNQQEINNNLQSTSTPIQSGTMNSATQEPPYNPVAAKQTQATQQAGAGSAMLAPMAAPNAAIAAKANADSGGTNVVQNRYTMPNTAGLTFGGT